MALFYQTRCSVATHLADEDARYGNTLIARAARSSLDDRLAARFNSSARVNAAVFLKGF
jgi:hypothetical protein